MKIEIARNRKKKIINYFIQHMIHSGVLEAHTLKNIQLHLRTGKYTNNSKNQCSLIITMSDISKYCILLSISPSLANVYNAVLG